MKTTRAREAKKGQDKKQKIKQTSRVTSSAAAFCGLAGGSSGFCAGGGGGWFKTAAAEPLEGFGPPGLGLHGLPF